MVETTVFRQLFFRCELALSPNKVLLNSRLKIDNKSLVETCTTINCLPEVNVEKEEIYFINKIPKKVKVIMSVPAMLIDGEQMIFGSKTMTEIIEALA